MKKEDAVPRISEKTITPEQGRDIRRGLFYALLLNTLANIFAVQAVYFLNRLLVDVRHQQLIRQVQTDPMILLFTAILPFPVIIFLTGWIFAPLWRESRKGTLTPNGLKWLANLALTISIGSGLGWVWGTFIFEAQIVWRGYSSDLSFLVPSTLISLGVAGIAFVMSYHMLEYFQRKFLIKRLFKDSEYFQIQNALRPSLRLRFSIFSLAAFLIPGLITFRLIQILNNTGTNVYGRDIATDMLWFYIIVGISVIGISVLLINSIRDPLQHLVRQASKIQNGDYSDRTMVDTRDEIGELTGTMNFMNESLAEKAFMKDAFGRMVDPTVRDYVLRGNINLGGEAGSAAVLFSDLQGFTNMSENKTPEEIVTLLNEYFTVMSECIASEGGVINKFIGDAILAVFGMPVSHTNPADAALRCAIKMQTAGKKLNEKLRDQNLPTLHTRIGVHFGPVIGGNIGSASRMEYTVIGDTVNIASRLESACKKLKCEILISDALRNSLTTEFALASAGNLLLKGKDAAVRAWKPVAI